MLAGVGKLLAGIWVVIGCVAAAAEAGGTPIRMLTYHVHPPFVTGEQQGLTYDLAELLNSHAALDGYQFTVVEVPRIRLNLMLQEWIAGACTETSSRCRDDWVVPWVNERWGWGSEPLQHYFWITLFADANLILSRSVRPLEYENPAVLDGVLFGGIRGHRYVGIDERVAAGAVTRLDGADERTNLIKLLLGRIDATLLPASTVRYYLQQDSQISGMRDELHISTKPHQTYQRSLMVPGTRADLADRLQRLGIADRLTTYEH